MSYVWLRATHKKQLKKHFAGAKKSPHSTGWCSFRCPGHAFRKCSLTEFHRGPHVSIDFFGRVVAAWSSREPEPR